MARAAAPRQMVKSEIFSSTERIRIDTKRNSLDAPFGGEEGKDAQTRFLQPRRWRSREREINHKLRKASAEMAGAPANKFLSGFIALRENNPVRVHFLLGPAGSGKTFRCLTEIRAALTASPEGPPLILLAPKQATFQLERQLLADASLPGYTRLQILSFERLAESVLAALHQPPPKLVAEEGRVMILRALLARHQDRLKLFRASARMPGFAQQLSALLREFQRYHLSPDRLETFAARRGGADALAHKLQDLALLLRAYRDWLRTEGLQDADQLLDVATESLREAGAKAADSARGVSPPPFRLAGLWLDGFAEMTPQELDLLAALAPFGEEATLAFCLDRRIDENEPPLSAWSTVGQTFRRCYQRWEAVPGCALEVEILERRPDRGRFAGNPALQHLEAHWMNPRPFDGATRKQPTASIGSADVLAAGSGGVSPPAETPGGTPGELAGGDACATFTGPFIAGQPVRREQAAFPGAEETVSSQDALRVIACADPEAEAVFAAREILRFVRDGDGRYRDVAVLLRSLDGYHDVLRRVFTRCQIPFFLDRRESVAHHPLAELTRSAVRIAALGWRHEDWFGALKSGLAHGDATEIDWLENEALARGWDGDVWGQPLRMDAQESGRLEKLRQQVVPPFLEFARSIAAGRSGVTGAELAEALSGLWQELGVAQELERWSARTGSDVRFQISSSVHATVWEQMQDWRANLARAFASEALPLGEWLPILEAGLAGLTVGAIPPVLDQVLIGAIDRSRNPDLQLALVLGLNESMFPAPPTPDNLLTEADRVELSGREIFLGPTSRSLLGHEWYYGYIVCTRARQQVVLTFSLRDADENLLNPSPFIARLQRLFPALAVESASTHRPWLESEHASELVAPWLAGGGPGQELGRLFASLELLPGLGELQERLARFSSAAASDLLEVALTEQLYGRTLRSSVSRLEQFAACPFRFFVYAGLRAEERPRFELDAREQGSFQHEVLAEFHRQLCDQEKEWRDLTSGEARERIGRIAATLAPAFRGGLLEAAPASRFVARGLTLALQDFIETIIDWMPQYGFDPRAVELGFGGAGDPLPAWELDLGDGHRLALQGKIDRVDLAAVREADEALCVVIDYKSSSRQLDPTLLAGGVQLQLPAYLGVLRQLREARPVFGVARLVPAGVFYVNLRGRYAAGPTRREVLDNAVAARQKAYQHTGRFDFAVLRQLDQRSEATAGNQFKYHLNKNGTPHKNDRDGMESGQFARFLDAVENQLGRMGREIFTGTVKVDPYVKGRHKACDHCDYASVCRIDPWTHPFRLLLPPKDENLNRG
ncbi:MAG: PD-(D/E)XK nuclease family protein [Limisphaerales bacterium]